MTDHNQLKGNPSMEKGKERYSKTPIGIEVFICTLGLVSVEL